MNNQITTDNVAVRDRFAVPAPTSRASLAAGGDSIGAHNPTLPLDHALPARSTT